MFYLSQDSRPIVCSVFKYLCHAHVATYIFDQMHFWIHFEVNMNSMFCCLGAQVLRKTLTTGQRDEPMTRTRSPQISSNHALHDNSSIYIPQTQYVSVKTSRETKRKVISHPLPLPSQLSLSIAQITQQLGNSKLGLSVTLRSSIIIISIIIRQKRWQ